MPTPGKSTPEMKKTRKNPTKADKNLEKSKKAPVRESPEKGAPLQKDGMTIYPSATRSMEEQQLQEVISDVRIRSQDYQTETVV